MKDCYYCIDWPHISSYSSLITPGQLTSIFRIHRSKYRQLINLQHRDCATRFKGTMRSWNNAPVLLSQGTSLVRNRDLEIVSHLVKITNCSGQCNSSLFTLRQHFRSDDIQQSSRYHTETSQGNNTHSWKRPLYQIKSSLAIPTPEKSFRLG